MTGYFTVDVGVARETRLWLQLPFVWSAARAWNRSCGRQTAPNERRVGATHRQPASRTNHLRLTPELCRSRPALESRLAYHPVRGRVPVAWRRRPIDGAICP